MIYPPADALDTVWHAVAWVRAERKDGGSRSNVTSERVAIVTGGSRGIGRAVARRLARDGVAVVVGCAERRKAADEVVETIIEGGGRALSIQADVGDEAAVIGMFDRAEKEFGRLDVVVHPAARMSLALVSDLEVSVLDELHRTNVRGTFLVSREAARRLRAGGSLTNFSTSAIGMSLPTYGAYAASKGAVESLTLILARELRGRNITVNTIAPGATVTDMFLKGKSEAAINSIADSVPLQRLGTPEDIAEVVAYLM